MRLCKERQAGREVPTAATVTPAASPVDVPMPTSMFGSRKAPVIAPSPSQQGADVDADLADAVGMLDVEGTPLGFDAPEMLVDVSRPPRDPVPAESVARGARAPRPSCGFPPCVGSVRPLLAPTLTGTEAAPTRPATRRSSIRSSRRSRGCCATRATLRTS